MIRQTLFTAAIALGLSCGPQPSDDNGGGGATTAPLPTKAPYLLEMSMAATQPTGMPGIHSMAMGKWTDTDGHEKWLLVGGRINGFHGRSGPNSGFPQSFANTNLTVVDMNGGKAYSLPIPEAWPQFAQLKSTNMQSYQEGNTLIFIGGYGNPATEGFAKTTFDHALFIDVPAMGKAVIAGNTADAKSAIVADLQNDAFKVTGGELDKIGNDYYLVFGQDYEGVYETSLTGKYTNKVTQLSFDAMPPTSVTLGTSFTYENKPDSTYTPYHRRDLNVHPAMFEAGKGAVAYAGVFTKQFGAWTNPVLIQPNGSTVAVSMNSSFDQKANLYEAGSVLMYDDSLKQTYTSIIGGISDYVWNDTTNSVKSSSDWPIDMQLPWSRLVNTMVMDGKGNFVEFIQDKTQGLLPSWLGANGYFVQNSEYAYDEDFLDWKKVKAAGSKVLIGYFLGGINTQGPYTGNGMTQSRANNVIYAVYAKPVN